MASAEQTRAVESPLGQDSKPEIVESLHDLESNKTQATGRGNTIWTIVGCVGKTTMQFYVDQ